MQRIEEAISNAIKFRKYNALITETFDLARAQAKTAVGRGLQPFPVVIKDCFAMRAVRTTCASEMLANYVAPYTATVVSRLLEGGGCVIGKSNMDEFCMGTSSSKSFFGPVKSGFSSSSSFDTDWLIPGGSSGGSAVSVQLNIADVGLGSDTGGSVRNPAAFTGTFGLKPSYGVLSRHGLIPLVNSLDCPSILTADAAQCNRYFSSAAEMMAGRDTNDSTSVEAPKSCFMENRCLSGITVGIPKFRFIVPEEWNSICGPSMTGDFLKEYFNTALSKECWNAWNEAAGMLVKLGCNLKEVSMPHTEFSIICYHVIAETDISSNMARYDGVAYGHRSKNTFSTHEMYASSRSATLNEVVRRRILAGNYFLMKRHVEKYFGKALKVRRLIKQDFDRVFREEGCAALLTPVTSGIPPRFSEMEEGSYERERSEDFYTQPANMAGVPACSVPFAKTDAGLPISVQVLADHLNDGIVLDVASALQKLST